MTTFRLDNWVRQISQTGEEEISCSDCLDRIDEYVDAELAGEDLAVQEPVKQHLIQCQVCREEYETLHDLALLEKEGRVPSAQE